jgi:predicted DNA binding CopG/RHH family protein
MKKILKKIPKFKNEDEEAEFWNTHDSTDYLDWGNPSNLVFPNLKPTSRSISIRIPEYVINRVKVQANKLDIPYQSLMKQYIAEGASK